MAYDFPNSPTPGDEYTPPVGGQTYIWAPPRWLVKGIPPAGGGSGGGGIDEAPVDGKQYAREDAAWSEVVIPSTDWADISGKPSTFPPTVPIPWTDVSGKPTTFPPTLPIPWTDVSDKPATFPPTLPIAESDVTNLVSDLAAKAPLASPTFTGDPKAPTPATSDNDTSIATTAYVKANVAALVGTAGTTMDTLGEIETYLSGTIVPDISSKAPLSSPVFIGDPRAPTPATADNDTSIATTAFVKAQGYAPLANPVFTGDPQAPTPATSDNDTSIATTAYVKSSIAAAAPGSITTFLYKWSTNTAAPPASGEIRGNSSGLITQLYVSATGSDGRDYSTPLGILCARLNTKIMVQDKAVPGNMRVFYIDTYGTVGSGYLTVSVVSSGIYGALTDGMDVILEFDDAQPLTPTFISDTAPVTGATHGSMWWNSSNGNLYIRYNDGSSTQWVQINNTGAL